MTMTSVRILPVVTMISLQLFLEDARLPLALQYIPHLEVLIKHRFHCQEVQNPARHTSLQDGEQRTAGELPTYSTYLSHNQGF